MSAAVVAIAADTVLESPTNRFLIRIAERVAGDGHEVATVLLRQLPIESLLARNLQHPALSIAAGLLAGARAVVLASPIRLASYSGLLKLFLDALPHDVLREKVVLPIATGTSPLDVVSFECTLAPELSLLGSPHVLPTVFVGEQELATVDSLPSLARERIDRALRRLLHLDRPARTTRPG